MGFSGSGAVSGAAAGTAIMPGWGTLAGGVLGGLFGGSPEAQNTPAPMPTNYYGMNGSGMFYNPATGGYTSLDPRMSGADSGALMKYQQMIDSLTGGKNTVSSYAKQQADQLKTQINDPKTPAAMKQELQARLNTLNQSAQNTGDWQNPLGAIGVTDPNRQLEFQKQTGTVQDYLKSTLDSSMNQRALGENSALASRGLASSSNAQYGAGTRALDYGVASGQNEITANDYLRSLQSADEAKKYQMLGVAQTGENTINNNQLSQEQLALNQMMMGMQAGQGYNNSMDAWNRQGSAIDAANKGQTAQGWNSALSGIMGGVANGSQGSTFDWKKFGQGAAGTMSGTSPNLWNMVAQPSSGGFNWGGSSTQTPYTGGWNPSQPGATPSSNFSFSTRTH
jgi:hypothetical protein